MANFYPGRTLCTASNQDWLENGFVALLLIRNIIEIELAPFSFLY